VLDDLATAIEDDSPGRYSMSHAIERASSIRDGNRTDIVCATQDGRAKPRRVPVNSTDVITGEATDPVQHRLGRRTGEIV